METLHIPIEDWEQAALQELARARGLDPTTLARRLLGERIRIQCGALADMPPERVSQPDDVRGDSIELRLLRLFEE